MQASTRNHHVVALAALISTSACSLLFETPAPGTEGANDAQAAAIDADLPIDAGDFSPDARAILSVVDCGLMSNLRQADFLTPLGQGWEVLSPLSIQNDKAAFDLAVMDEDASSYGLKAIANYSPPYALDILVSDIPSEGDAEMLLSFDHNAGATDFIEVRVTATAVTVYRGNGGSQLLASEPRIPGTNSEIVRISQSTDTLTVDDSSDRVIWRNLYSEAIAGMPARPRIVARYTTAFPTTVPPLDPMLLHAIGVSCSN